MLSWQVQHDTAIPTCFEAADEHNFYAHTHMTHAWMQLMVACSLHRNLPIIKILLTLQKGLHLVFMMSGTNNIAQC